MLDKNMFANLRDKAQKTYEGAKSELSKIQNNIEDKLDEHVSEKNNLEDKNEKLVESRLVNKAVQLMFEKSINKVEQFINKYVRPYDVCEVTDREYIKYLITDIEEKIRVSGNDQYYYELVILYANLGETDRANEYCPRIKSEELKTELFKICSLLKLNDNDLYGYIMNNQETIVSSRIYCLLVRGADLCIESGNYFLAKSFAEKYCELNSVSVANHKKLQSIYSKLGEEVNSNIEYEIIRLLEN